MSASKSMSKLISRRAIRGRSRAAFGRGRSYAMAVEMPAPTSIGDDMKLFVSSFVGGLVFMTVYLA
jgi:hypothetical protein